MKKVWKKLQGAIFVQVRAYFKPVLRSAPNPVSQPPDIYAAVKLDIVQILGEHSGGFCFCLGLGLGSGFGLWVMGYGYEFQLKRNRYVIPSLTTNRI